MGQDDRLIVSITDNQIEDEPEICHIVPEEVYEEIRKRFDKAKESKDSHFITVGNTRYYKDNSKKYFRDQDIANKALDKLNVNYKLFQEKIKNRK